MKERYDDIDEYIRDLQAEISRNDQCANHYYNLGVALLSKGDFVEAQFSPSGGSLYPARRHLHAARRP